MCGPWERGVFFQSLRRCAHCKQDSRCALTRVASELGAKFQCRSRPPCRRIGLSYRCAGRFLASGGGLRPGRPDQVELTPTRCLPPPDLDRSHTVCALALLYLLVVSVSLNKLAMDRRNVFLPFGGQKTAEYLWRYHR